MSVNIMEGVMANEFGAIDSIMVSGANAFVIPSSSYLVDIPLYSSKHDLFDREIPFLPIVLRGYRPYSGEPANSLAQHSDARLRVVETGAVPYYRLIYEDPVVIKDTHYDHFHSVDHAFWMEELKSDYHQYQAIMADAAVHRIVGHRQVMPGVYETQYENGDRVIVNYLDRPVHLCGGQIEARSYRRFTGDE